VNTFADPLHRAERCFPDAEAVVCGRVRLRFGELVDRCRRLAGFVSQHTAHGDRVAILAANSHQVLELFCGVPACGRVVVPLNNRHALPEVEYALRDARPRILFTDRMQDIDALSQRVEVVVPLGDGYEERIDHAGALPLGVGVSDRDLAGLFYTGGTTGAAKGVMLSHRNKIADTFHLQCSVRLEEGDAWQIMGPMFHASGTFNVLLCLWVGARQIVLPGFDAAGALDVIAAEKTSITFGVPTMLAALVDEQEARPRDVGTLRLLGYGAAPASTSLLRRVHDCFPHVELVSMYGATELGPMGTTIEHLERYIDDERARSAGRAIVGVDLRIVDASRSELGPREVGEVELRGENVMVGYWEKPEQTAEVLRDGWYASGDVGFLDEGGCLFLVDRKKDVIISGGENVYSTEVEEILYQHPAVAECAVYGVPDEKWGEAVQASVHPRDGADVSAEALAVHCRASLAGYKVPKVIEVRDEPLPKSGAGKILKRELRAPFWKGRDREIH